MSTNHTALNKPKSISETADAQEMIRFWLSENVDHVSLMVGAVDDADKEPPMWGFILADIAKHITQAIRQTNPDGPDATAIMTQIMDGFAERIKHAPILSGTVAKD